MLKRENRIIEKGDHRCLMAQGVHWTQLFNTCFRHQSLAYIEAISWRLELGYAAAD